MRLSELLGLPVTSRSGERLGRVHDVRAELGERELHITGLVVGTVGILEHFGIGAPRSAARIRTRDVVPWASVARIDRRGVVVEDGTEPR